MAMQKSPETAVLRGIVERPFDFSGVGEYSIGSANMAVFDKANRDVVRVDLIIRHPAEAQVSGLGSSSPIEVQGFIKARNCQFPWGAKQTSYVMEVMSARSLPQGIDIAGDTASSLDMLKRAKAIADTDGVVVIPPSPRNHQV